MYRKTAGTHPLSDPLLLFIYWSSWL